MMTEQLAEHVAALEDRVTDLEVRGEAATGKRHHVSGETERVELRAWVTEIEVMKKWVEIHKLNFVQIDLIIGHWQTNPVFRSQCPY